MEATQNTRLERLTNFLKSISGQEIEITFRGEKSFTVSFDCQDSNAQTILVEYFKKAAKKVTSDYDEECEQTCIWIEA
jgi:hypothetical protein